MAYVFRFPTEITEILYSMRDWKYERVKWRRGTPSKIALSPYKIMNHTIEHVPRDLFPSTYWITVRSRFGGYWIDGLYDNKFDKVIAHDWTNGICKKKQSILCKDAWKTNTSVRTTRLSWLAFALWA